MLNLLPRLVWHRFGVQLLTKRLEILVLCIIDGLELLERVAVPAGVDQFFLRSAVEHRFSGVVKQERGEAPVGDVFEICKPPRLDELNNGALQTFHGAPFIEIMGLRLA